MLQSFKETRLTNSHAVELLNYQKSIQKDRGTDINDGVVVYATDNNYVIRRRQNKTGGR